MLHWLFSSENMFSWLARPLWNRRIGRLPALVGHDNLELIAFLMWGEQSQLHRLLGLFFHSMAQKQESVAMLPTRGCPVALEVIPLGVQTLPPPSGLDRGLQLCEAFERNGDTELHALGVQEIDRFVAEKGRIFA